jgi:hypothetical protein
MGAARLVEYIDIHIYIYIYPQLLYCALPNGCQVEWGVQWFSERREATRSQCIAKVRSLHVCTLELADGGEPN